MKKKGLSILFVLLFLAFIGVMDYPFVSRMLNERVQGQVVVGYAEAADSMEEDETSRMLEAAGAYNEALAFRGGAGMKELLEDGTGMEEEYASLLDLDGSGVMGSIEIPKINVNLPVYHGTTEEVLQMGAGHLEGTSLPIGGENTHASISAHRGLPMKKMFTSLDQLENGDVFYLHVLGRTLAYQVEQTETVLPHQVDALAIVPGEDRVTLITCTPYGINTHRIYVHGVRIPYEEAVEAEAAAAPPVQEGILRQYWWVFLTLLLLVWMCWLLYYLNREEDPRREPPEG